MANVIVNGTFANKGSGWSYSDRVDFSTPGLCVFESKGRDGQIYIAQTVTLAPGKTYQCKFEGYAIGRFDCWGAYTYTNASGVAQHVNGPSLEGKLSSWGFVNLSFDIALPANARSNQVTIFIKGGASNNGSLTFLQIKNVSLDNQETTLPPIVGPNPTIKTTFSGSNVHTDVAFRAGPGTEYAYVTGVPESPKVLTFHTFTNVGTTAQQRSWLAHLSGNRYLFVSAQFIGMYIPASGTTSQGPVAKTTTGVWLRELPDGNSKQYRLLGAGTKVVVIDTSVSGWWRVITSDGVGWVSSQYLQLVP